MIITQNVFNKISECLINAPVESGGILGTKDRQVIDEFYYDKSGIGTANSYTPDVESINSVILNDWSLKGIELVGIIHTHVNGTKFPSCGDFMYGEQILKSLKNLDWFYMPIALTENSELSVYGYKIFLDNQGHIKCEQVEISVI